MEKIDSIVNRAMKGLELKIVLTRKGITQRQVAQKAGVTEGYISLIINGFTTPSSKARNALKELGVDWDNLSP